MSADDEPVSLKGCAFPGTVKVTRSALMQAERFQTVVPAGWIVTFFWSDGQRMKANKDAPWVDLGPGLDLGAYRNTQIPEEAVFTGESLRYAVLILKEILDAYPEKVVDADATGKIILR